MNLIKKVTKSIFKKFGYKLINVASEKSNYTKASKLLEVEYGHYESKKLQMSIDSLGNPIPWFTYPAIDYLSQLDLADKVMLEWGAGNSSLFFAKRVKTLYSIEHNNEWYKQVKNNKIDNHILILEQSNYSLKPKELLIEFDIILIDGINRNECSEVSVEMIKEKGMIILDNSDRHPDICENLRNFGLIEVDFHGFGPINDYTWTTSVFFHRDFDIRPLSIQPIIPIGGGF
jgi:hypothetical protein